VVASAKAIPWFIDVRPRGSGTYNADRPLALRVGRLISIDGT
jgi:hypothetical protein